MTSRPATWVEAGLTLLVLVFALSWWTEHRTQTSEALTLAHAATQRAERVSAHADTVFRRSDSSASVLRMSYRTRVDTLRLRQADTVTLKQTLRMADTVIAGDALALADAARAIEAHQETEARLHVELAVALQPHPPPRLSTTVAALYDPVHGTPSGSVQVGWRVIGRAQLIGRIEQRLALSGTPQVMAGMAITF